MSNIDRFAVIIKSQDIEIFKRALFNKAIQYSIENGHELLAFCDAYEIHFLMGMAFVIQEATVEMDLNRL